MEATAWVTFDSCWASKYQSHSLALLPHKTKLNSSERHMSKIRIQSLIPPLQSIMIQPCVTVSQQWHFQLNKTDSPPLMLKEKIYVIISTKFSGSETKGTSKKNWIWWKSNFFLVTYLKKIETFIDFRFITCKVKHFKSVLFLFWWLEPTANESQKTVSQNFRIFTFEFQ